MMQTRIQHQSKEYNRAIWFILQRSKEVHVELAMRVTTEGEVVETDSSTVLFQNGSRATSKYERY
jgi:hypothetical protein